MFTKHAIFVHKIYDFSPRRPVQRRQKAFFIRFFSSKELYFSVSKNLPEGDASQSSVIRR